jgi:DNA-binding GntR family transcriptional regulator
MVDAGPERLRRGAHRSLRAAAYDVLREYLITGRLAAGERINLVDVQRMLGVGLSAIREAMCQLAAEGLVVAEEQCGFVAAPISAQDLVDLTTARVEVECFALRDAIARGDLLWEERIITEFHKLAELRAAGPNRALRAPNRAQDMAFHDALVATCGSQWMLRFRRMLYNSSERYAERYSHIGVLDPVSKRDADEDHRAIMEAAIARDADRAVALITQHLEEAARILLRIGITG